MKIYYLAIVLFLASCDDSGNDCYRSVDVVLNNSGSDASTITISNGLNSVELKAGAKAEKNSRLCFSNELTHDGSYRIAVRNPSIDTVFSFGYYSNGVPLENSIHVTLAGKSISVKTGN